MLSPMKRKIENTRKPRRRLCPPLFLVTVKSARKFFIILRAMDALRLSHLFVVLFLPHNTDLASRFTLGLLPSLQLHASRMPQAFVLPLYRSTIIPVIIVANPDISQRNARTPNSITQFSKGRLSANHSRASSRTWLKKVKMHRGANP